jgi:toxin CcdB
MQFDVHANAGDSRSHTPFLVNIQADLLDHLETRVVVPLIRAERFGRRAEQLHPMFEINQTELVLATHLLAAVRTKGLGPVADNLNRRRDDILAAVDVLWAGSSPRSP